MAAGKFGIDEEYVENLRPAYFLDKVHERQVHQPDAYALADYLCRVTGRHILLDIGCGSGAKLSKVSEAKRIIGCDIGANLVTFSHEHPRWEPWEVDLEHVHAGALPSLPWSSVVVVCADVIEHLIDPTALAVVLGELTGLGAIVVVTTPDRARLGPETQSGPPRNPSHVREWTLSELEGYLASSGGSIAFAGHTISDNLRRTRQTSLVILDEGLRDTEVVVSTRRPLGVVATYNDVDCIEAISKYHLDEGLDLWFLDNWSSDGTFERLTKLQERYPDRVTVERFPAAGPAPEYRWVDILARKEEVSAQFPGRWILHIDSDEHRAAPWSTQTLSQAIARVDAYGANCIDFCVVEFPPTRDGFSDHDDPIQFFDRYKFARHLSHFVQLRAWKQPEVAVDLRSTGGHEAKFLGRKVFPYRFYLGHYPVRSNRHARQKIITDRRQRYSKYELERLGWHTHYDGYDPDLGVIKWAELLEVFNFDTFRTEMLPELVSDVVWKHITGSLNW